MNRRLPSLSLLRAFERAAHHSSVKLAANDLYVTPGAVSQKIKQLEQELGIPLFRREGRSIRLTAAGKGYYRDVARAFARLETGTQRLQDQFGAQVLRLHLLPFFASAILIPRLPAFQAAHPDIEVRIESSFGLTGEHPEGADLSVILGNGDWPGLKSNRLLDIHLQPVACPEIAATIRPDHPEDINQHTIVRFTSRLDAWEQWTRQSALDFAPQGQFGVDSMFSALTAAEQGLGVAMAVRPVTDEKIQQSSLQYVLNHSVPAIDSYYLVYRASDAVRPGVAIFRDWLMEQFVAESLTLPSGE